MNILVDGCGYWGTKHVRVFKELGHVVYVHDISRTRQEKVVEQFGVQPAKLPVFRGDIIDAAVIATPASDHYRLAKQALGAGIHVLCEKPLCITMPQARELIEIASNSRKTLQTGYIYLHHPVIHAIESLMPELGGQPWFMTATRTNLGPIRKDVDVIYDLAVHDISIFNYLMRQAPHTVAAQGIETLGTSHADAAAVILRYPGALGEISVSWGSPGKARLLSVTGDRQTLVFCESKPAQLSWHHADGQHYPHVPSWEPLVKQAEVFLGRAQRHAAPDADFELGIMATLVAAAESVRQGGIPIRTQEEQGERE